MRERRAGPGGDQQGAELVAVQGGRVGLIIPGAAGCGDRTAPLEKWLARGRTGSAGAPRGNDEGILTMWVFFSRRLRMWLLLAIAVPLTRALVHRVALAAERRDPSTRTAKVLHEADSAVTAVSQRAGRKGERREPER